MIKIKINQKTVAETFAATACLTVLFSLFIANFCPGKEYKVFRSTNATQESPPNQEPNDTLPFWSKFSGPLSFSVGDRYWIGIQNDPNDRKRKKVLLHLFGSNLDNLHDDLDLKNDDNKKIRIGAVGKPNMVKQRSIYLTDNLNDDATQRTFTFIFDKQTAGEWISLVAKDKGPIQLPIIKSVCGQSYCFVYKKGRETEPNKVQINSLCVADLSSDFNDPNSLRITEVWLCSENSDLDPNATPTLDAPPGSGTWSYTGPNNIDPYGNRSLEDFIKWESDGAGIMANEEFSSSFYCTDSSTDAFDVYLYDANSSEYLKQTFYTYSLVADLDDNDYVDFNDFSIFAQEWLECTDPTNPQCQ